MKTVGATVLRALWALEGAWRNKLALHT